MTVPRFVALSIVFLIAAPGAHSAVPRDRLFKDQWGLKMIRAREAWQISTGRGVMVAVLDSGVDLRHPDLRANIDPNGYDFLDDDSRPRDERSGRGHGTHVAGIIAAARNGTGVVGVAPAATILPVRVCDYEYCTVSAIARGIHYAIDRGSRVINLSLALNPTGEADGQNEVVRDAIEDATRRGIVVVAAAGNYLLPLCMEPARSVLCVGAVSDSKEKTLYSNHDATVMSNYVVAPGGNDLPTCENIILSTFPRYLDSVCGKKGYEAMNGTSMAAPHVAGVAALLAAQGLRGERLIEALLSSAEDLGAPGRDPVYGSGLVNAEAAVLRADEQR